MFDFVKQLFKRSKVEESNPFIDADGREWMLGRPEIPTQPSKSSGSLLRGMGRDPADSLRACDIKKCVRPSVATILTTDELDVDIPDQGYGRGGVKRGILPVYQEYRLCDRCYKQYGRGSGTKFAVSSHPVYDPDKHEQTQKKLATKTRKTSK